MRSPRLAGQDARGAMLSGPGRAERGRSAGQDARVAAAQLARMRGSRLLSRSISSSASAPSRSPTFCRAGRGYLH